MPVGNPTHRFKDGTTTANTTVSLPGVTGRTVCAWWAIRNSSDTDMYVKSETSGTPPAFVDDATDAILIQPGEYKIVGLAGPNNSYDLQEYGVFCTASAKAYVIEYKKV